MKSLSIANTMTPSQRGTVQSIPNPREFSPSNWMFDPIRANAPDWRPSNADLSNNNYYSQKEGYQNIKNGMFNPLTGAEPVNGHVNYFLKPLDQEQTNAHMSGYKDQKITRVADNMNPAFVMRFPPYQYPINDWRKVFQGSQSTRPYTPFSQVPNQSFNPAR